MSATVGLQLCKEYDFNKVYDSILELFRLVPPPDFKDKVVLLKPNILYPKKPELAVCTHPVVVGAAVKAFLSQGAKKVLVGESPAMANPTTAAKITGMYNQVIDNGGVWTEFKDSVVVSCPQGLICKQFNFASQIKEADLVVSLSKLKTHQFMTYTGAMKNLFGLMIGLEKAQTHYRFPKKEDFANFLTDLNIAAGSNYAIMDAIVGMEGPGGPGSGTPKKLGFLAASTNLLALDWECASLVGYNPHTIVYLEEALKRKIWFSDEKEITTLGAAEKDCRCTSFKIVKEASPTLQKMIPGWINFIANKFFIKTPVFNPKKCMKCRKCMEICPPHLIKMTGKNETAFLSDRNKCQHCYCCHEICPHDAIKLKRF